MTVIISVISILFLVVVLDNVGHDDNNNDKIDNTNHTDSGHRNKNRFSFDFWLKNFYHSVQQKKTNKNIVIRVHHRRFVHPKKKTNETFIKFFFTTHLF